jgi:hypothetical protein
VGFKRRVVSTPHTWCGYKLTGLMLEYFLLKNYKMEMSPSMYSPPRSLHHSMRILHCWNQCYRSSSDSLFMSSVAFAFTASVDSNLFPFNVDLIFANKKSYMGARSGKYGGCSNSVVLCFIKNLVTDRALCASTLSWWWTHGLFFHISDIILLTY